MREGATPFVGGCCATMTTNWPNIQLNNNNNNPSLLKKPTLAGSEVLAVSAVFGSIQIISNLCAVLDFALEVREREKERKLVRPLTTIGANWPTSTRSVLLALSADVGR